MSPANFGVKRLVVALLHAAAAKERVDPDPLALITLLVAGGASPGGTRPWDGRAGCYHIAPVVASSPKSSTRVALKPA